MAIIKPMLINCIGKILIDTRVSTGLTLKINKFIFILQRKQVLIMLT